VLKQVFIKKTEHTMVFEFENVELKALQDELKGEMRKYGNIAKLTDLIGVFHEKDFESFLICITH
jgi:hypothetical protein